MTVESECYFYSVHSSQSTFIPLFILGTTNNSAGSLKSSFNFNSESILIILLRRGTLVKEELNECGFVLDLSYTLI